MNGMTPAGMGGRPYFEALEARLLLSGDSTAIELFSVSTAVFVENQGQWADETVRYAFHGDGATVLHTDAGPVFHLYERADADPAATR